MGTAEEQQTRQRPGQGGKHSHKLVVKLPPWWWPEHTEESSSAWQAELTPGHWEGPDPLKVPYSCSRPSGSSWACRMSYYEWELLDSLV